MPSVLKKFSDFLQLYAPRGDNDDVRLQSARWLSSNTGLAILTGDWQTSKKMPPLRLKSGMRLREILRVPPFMAGIAAGYYIDGGNVVFVLSPALYKSCNIPTDAEVFVAGTFNGWGSAIGDERWQLRQTTFGSTTLWQTVVPKRLVFGGASPEVVAFKFVSRSQEWFGPPPDAYNLVLDDKGNGNLCASVHQTGWHVFKFITERPIDFGEPDELVWDSKKSPHSLTIDSGYLMSQIFSLDKLGAIVSDSGTKTTFRIFAPRASRVVVEFWNPKYGSGFSQRSLSNFAEKYGSGFSQRGLSNFAEKYGSGFLQRSLSNFAKRIPEAPRKRVELTAMENGIWQAVTRGNLDGWYYNFFVSGKNSDNSSAFDDSVAILDPYAKVAVSRSGPAIVFDEKKLHPVRSSFRPPHIADLVIAEVHLRDLIAKHPRYAGNKRLGFREMAEWVRSEDCYLKKLGVNAVELQPIQEFDAERQEDYHWGYMTNNWFAPASHYASDPTEGTQIEEFRELVDALHSAGFAVILDVVYNHVGEPNHLLRIDKEYYFNLTQHGDFTNWSGCGNDYNADVPMSRRLLNESLLWMLEAYGVDGFRFDLAELVGVPALISIEKTIRARFPDAILIAEPWSFRGHVVGNLRKTSYSSWNDGFRDYVAKYVHNNVNLEGLKYFLAGSPEYFATFPAQTINYTESHDDRCWLDKITECAGFNAERPTVRDRRRTHIMLAFLLSSLGTPMLAEGQDFLRTKHGKNNTYLDGEENALDYSRLKRFSRTHEYARAWIRFRLSPHGRLFRQRKCVSGDFFRFYPGNRNVAAVVVYNAAFSQGKLQYLLMLNPRTESAVVQTPRGILFGFRQIANSKVFNFLGVHAEKGFEQGDGFLVLPPLSISLWIRGEDH